MKTSFVIRLTARQCTLLSCFLLLFNVLLLLGSGFANEWLHHPKGPALKFLLNQTNLGIENVLATWYSSMLLLLVALGALLCFLCDRQEKKPGFKNWLSTGWLFFSLIFLTLSLDEMGSFHEMIGETALFQQLGFGKENGWTVFYLLIGGVAVFMILFFITRVKTSRRSFVCMALGTLLFISNPVQEVFEINSYRTAADPNNWQRPTVLFLLEEGSEIFGALCFLAAMLCYALDRCRQLCLSSGGIQLAVTLKNSRLFWATALALVLGFVLLGLLNWYDKHKPAGDDGIAANWFPSALFFLVALCAIFNVEVNQQTTNKIGYGLLAFLTLLYSAYFGSNMYNSPLLYQSVISGITLHHVLLLVSFGVAEAASFFFTSKWSRLCFLGYGALLFLQAFSLPVPAPFTGYVAASLLMGGFALSHVAVPKVRASTVPAFTFPDQTYKSI